MLCNVTLQARNARVTINAVHPGIVKTGIIRDHKGFITGKNSSFIHNFRKKKNGREEKRRRVKTNDMFMNMCCRFSVFHSIKATKIDLSGNVVIHITLYDE